ncbi:flavodoxin family protein [Thermodesulfobacteriota bacterium]
MKIIAFVGSPRKGSNVDLLIDQVIEGARSKTEVEAEKIYLYSADIQNCNACGVCSPLQGNKDCPLQDDMVALYPRMQAADAFIFGSPNHVHTITAAMTNLFARMQPLIKMEVIRDESGKIVDGRSNSLIQGKKAVMVVSQGDFSPSASALVLRCLDSNIKDFRLKKIGEVFSTGNLERAAVKQKEADLQQAFARGVRLAVV